MNKMNKIVKQLLPAQIITTVANGIQVNISAFLRKTIVTALKYALKFLSERKERNPIKKLQDS